ncbi:MAG TPA: sodium:proton antiporter [Alphaproteobacteria bacterium]|nr:sodium:proton antiporter [Alphaproteobacteria bacterium]USO05054.1 MAG: sodium:proton antiporter [Rhodospirillales bacterium]HOO81674.1 sodium:proton antiporter [Alphaproteobacteria bacterium]
MYDILSQIAWIAFFSIAAQWLGWRLKTPAIVFLLIGGFLAGPTLNLVQPETLLGDLLNPVISLAVGIILFEGALNLNFKEIREARASIRQVILVGAPVAWLLTTLAGHYVAGLSLPVALTFGALLIVTGPTVIMPLLKNAHLKERPASILKWEGIINDPIGAVLAVLCYEFFRLQALENVALSEFFTSTVLAIIMITFFGVAIAYSLSWLFNHDVVPEYLKPTALLSTALIYFVICNSIEHDFGLIGVTILGVALANMGISSIEELKKFKETISIMLVSGVFILLTTKIDPAILFSIDWRGFAFIAMLLFVIRPLTLLASSIGTKMSWQEVILTGWIAPRGIVCAAVAGVLGPYMVGIGYQDGEQILALAFAIVLFTVFAHGLSAKPVAQKLKLAYTGKDSLIIVGASEWAVQFAKMLKGRDVDVMIADKNWHALREARLSDIPTYYGEILSEETEYHLELARYNTLLAVSNNPAYNALICNMFIHEFGRDKVYQFLPHEENEHERRKIAHTIRGRTFGQADMDYWDIAGDYMQGWRFRASRAGQEENRIQFQQRIEEGNLKIVGYITQKGRLDLRQPESLEKFEEQDLLIFFEQGDS